MGRGFSTTVAAMLAMVGGDSGFGDWHTGSRRFWSQRSQVRERLYRRRARRVAKRRHR